MKRSTLLLLNSFQSFTGSLSRASKTACLSLFFSLLCYSGFAAVSVTPGSGGTNICSTVATSANTLGPITITEGLQTDFPTGGSSITLAPPAGWQFVVSLPTISASGGDVTIGVISMTTTALTINFNASGTANIDVITISNLQFQATTTGAAAGNIFASSDFGVAGIVVGSAGTNFGSLSITPAVTPSVTISASPSGPICAGTGVTFTPSPVNGGASPTFLWFVNGGFVGSAGFYSTSTLANADAVDALMIPTSGGCFSPATASSNTITMTVNPVPNPVSVTGGGTFCGSTTINATLAGAGTVYFQGTTSGGTSTATPSTSQVISTSGTYYFRAQGAGGCWGAEGSVSVIINTPATANAGVPQSVCAGGTITLAGSIGGSASSSSWSAGSGTFSNPASLTSTYTPSIPSGTVTLTLSTDDPDGAGPCPVATSNVIITVNALPTVVTVTGGGAACGSTILSGANGGSGTIFFQGTTSGGTSTVLGGTPQTITTSGTYYFRAQSGAGCWGPEGSAAVTINTPATANAGAPQTVCAGGTITLAGSIGGSATSSTWSAGSGTFSDVTSLTSTYTPSIPSGTVTLTLTTNDPDGAGPCPAATSTVVITVNPLPAAPAVSGAGTFCFSTSISATLGGPGTLFFQGSTSGGTSTTMGGSPQIITASGTYFFRAQSAAGCWGPESSVSVTINPLPVVYNVLGGGSYCLGGTGVDVSLSSSDAGINYRLMRGATLVTIMAGTGATLDFGLQTIAGTYTVVAVNPSTGCNTNMAGTANVSINPLPTQFTVTGGGSYCSGGTGVLVNLSGSAVGVNYQLLLGGLPIGAAVAGTGGLITFGLFTGAGVYTATATNTITGCINNMLGSATITINPLPTAFSVTGGGGYCAGGSGVVVGLGNSTVGVNYQLFVGASAVGGPVAGTGSALNFGLQTTAGTYTVVATNTTTGCVNTMTGSATVTINPLPGVFTVTGGGSYCSGGTGVSVGLSGSASGINYQLMLGASPVGAAMAGTGSALDFGLFTAAGTYTVVATDATSLCTSNMTGSAVVSIDPLPTVFTVAGGGSYCTGGSGVNVTLLGSTAGISYQLYNLFAPLGAPLIGTGGILSFGLQTAAGFYTIVATNTVTGCTSNMSGGVAVTIIPLPTVYNVIGGGPYCAGGAGVHVGLDGSDVGTNYQLFMGVTPVGVPVAGTGSALDLGLQSAPGTYTVVATDASTGCINTMAGSTVISINPLPATFAITGGGIYCSGGTGVNIGLAGSVSGVNYQLYNGASPVGAPLPGTGSALDFGLITGSGTYSVIATDVTTTCSENMTGTATVAINPAPTGYTVTGGGAYCAGGTGVNVGLASSDVGVDYQLLLGGVPVGATLSGTGAALDFGLQMTPGTYTVSAMIISTGCTGLMAGSVDVSINSLPTSYVVLGGGTFCSGGAGVDVSIAGSDAGVNYQLFNGASAVGLPLAGTGSALDFGLQTAPGTYTVVATNATTACTNTMASSAVVAVNPLPVAYTVAGGGTYCVGGAGFDVTLSSSDAGIDYQLFNSGVPVGAAMSGTGSMLDFGFQTAAGTYTIVGTNTATGCNATMSGSSVIIVSPYPVVDVITGPVVLCQGTTIALADSTPGGVWSSADITIATVSSGGVVTGVSGGAVDISYTVTNGGGCSTSVTYNENVLPAPVVAAITGTANVCMGLTVTLSDATPGGVWSTSNPGIAIVTSSGVVTGISTGVANISYTVTSGTTGCSSSSVTSMTVGSPMPALALLPVGSATLCHGMPVNLSVVTTGGGLTYQWYVAGSPILGEVSSTYTATTAGMYTASVSNGSCSVILPATNVVNPPMPVISLDTLPNLLFTGSFVTYQWYLNGVAIPGATTNNVLQGPTGSIYTVVVSDINGCTDTSAVWIVGGSTVLNVNPVINGSDIKVYPNPASSILHIDAPVKVFVSVLTTDGRLFIDHSEAVSVNVGQLADGMYMIMVYDEHNNLLKAEKFMKVQ